MTQHQESKKYPLTNDLLFKAVFGRDEVTSKYMLKELLNALLHLEGKERINHLTHKNPFSMANNYTEKETIFDIKVELENGEQVDIEMQVEATFAYRKRSLFYWAKMHAEQPLRGKNYNEVCKSICINIVNSVCIHESKQLHNVFQVIESKEYFVLCEDLEIHYFQLPNLRDIIMSDATSDGSILGEELDDEELWLFLIREAGRGDEAIIRSLVDKKDVLKMTYEAYDNLNKDALMKEKLEAHQKYLWDRSAREDDVRREGIEQGIEQGIELVAKTALREGATIDFVVKITNLDKKLIEKIRDELK